MPFLAPTVLIFFLKIAYELHQLYLLNLLHDVVAAVAKAPVSQTLLFCSVREFESGRGQKYECNFFYTDFLNFFFLRNKKGVLINHVDTLLKAFDCPNPFYRIVSLHISKASLQCNRGLRVTGSKKKEFLFFAFYNFVVFCKKFRCKKQKNWNFIKFFF